MAAAGDKAVKVSFYHCWVQYQLNTGQLNKEFLALVLLQTKTKNCILLKWFIRKRTIIKTSSFNEMRLNLFELLNNTASAKKEFELTWWISNCLTLLWDQLYIWVNSSWSHSRHELKGLIIIISVIYAIFAILKQSLRKNPPWKISK